MDAPHSLSFSLLPIAAWFALHLGGLLLAWLSRLSINRRADQATQFLLTASFCAIALLAAMQLGHEYQLSLLSATTLGMMVIAAVYDGRPEASGHSAVGNW